MAKKQIEKKAETSEEKPSVKSTKKTNKASKKVLTSKIVENESKSPSSPSKNEKEMEEKKTETTNESKNQENKEGIKKKNKKSPKGTDLSKYSNPKLSYGEVNKKVLYIKPHSALEDVVFCISIFYFSLIPVLYQLDVEKQNIIIISWIFFFISGMGIIDINHRLRYFPQKRTKYIILISIFAASFLMLFAFSIVWMVFWDLKEFPVLIRLFSS